MSNPSTSQREKMDLADFAGPHRSFPITSQAQVHSAARLIGHAANPAAVKARVIAIAKRRGFDLPESWKASDSGAMEDELENARLLPSNDAQDGMGTGKTGGPANPEENRSRSSPTIGEPVQKNSRPHDEPSGDSMHVDAPIGKVPAVRPSRHFLTRFMSHVRQRAGERGTLTVYDVNEAIRVARGHAGGRASADARSGGSQGGVRVMFEPWTQDAVGAYDEEDDSVPTMLDSMDDDDDEGEDAEDEALLEGPRLAKDHPAVKYRAAEKPNQHCGDCRFYVPDWDCDGDPQCRLVEGLIEPSFVCGLFMPPVDLGYAARAAGELADLCHSNTENPPFRLFMELPSTATTTPPEWVNMLPVPGVYTHQRWGPVTITPERNARFVDNFQHAVYQERLPIDAEHETKLSGATGWIRGLRQNSDGSVDARMEWTPRGKQFLQQGAFRYVSPEWYDEWVDPATGQAHSDVLIGGAMTTRPFFKERSLRPIIANERGLSILGGPTDSLNNCDPFVFTTLERRDLPMATTEKKPPVSDDDADDKAKAATEPVASSPATSKPITMSEEDYRAFTEMRGQLAELRQANETKDAELKAATEAIGTMRSDERRQRFTEEIAGRSSANGAPYAGDHTKALGVMTALATQFGEDSDVFKDYVAGQRASAEQLKASAIFHEIGTSGSQSFADTTPLSRIDTLAKQYVENHPDVSIERARSVVMTENPQLYDEYKSTKPGR